MVRTRFITFAALAVGAVLAGTAVESVVGKARYELNSATYSIPHKYEFTRNFSLPWLQGLPKEPDESVWLLFPASELARDLPGYKQWFHGYVSEVEANFVVNVRGGKEAREFTADRSRDLSQVALEIAKSSPRQNNGSTGWDRVYWSVGEKGTPGEGHSLFYLIPSGGLDYLSPGWRVPYCRSSPDVEGRETYSCDFTIYQNELTYNFMLQQENLGMADVIPDYVLSRLRAWRD